MSLVFWDTNVFVYWMEDHAEWGPKVEHVRLRMLERGDQLCTSALTVGELLAGPHKQGNRELAERYRGALRPPWVQVLSFELSTAEHYARIRARWPVRPADAMQLACAAEAKVDLFLTNDQRLNRLRVPGIQFLADLDVNVL
jgi:predicted nucleic acid-binding protein